jgi:hypothetical protein
MLENGTHATIEEIAAAEKINESSRVLRLTLLAPDIVESILDGRQLAALTLAVLMKPFPVEWEWRWRTFTTAKPKRTWKKQSRASHGLNKN